MATPETTPLTETLTDPISGASITLPKLNGLTVNEVQFIGWTAEHLPHLRNGLNSTPAVVGDLTTFCHTFLCLRLGKADWGGDGLVFEGEPLTPADTLTMSGADGQAKAAPLYMLYLVYGFAINEEQIWLGEHNPGMLQAVLGVIEEAKRMRQSTGEPSGEASTGDSSENTPTIPGSRVERLDDAPSTSSKTRSTSQKKAA